MSRGIDKKKEALQRAAAKKASLAYEKTETALREIIAQNLPINFTAVAKRAGVTTAYLYQKPELKERIVALRDQQGKQTKAVKLSASDESRQVRIITLKNELKKLRVENQELRKANESLAGRLYEANSATQLAERLQVENERLRAKNNGLVSQLAQFEASVAVGKVVGIKQATASGDLSDAVQQKLALLKIKPNPTLRKKLKNSPENIVINALDAYEQASNSGTVKNIGGWLIAAIDGQWMQNDEARQQKQCHPQQAEQEEFTRWFNAAKDADLVFASQLWNDDILLYLKDGSTTLFSHMKQEYSLENLLTLKQH